MFVSYNRPVKHTARPEHPLSRVAVPTVPDQRSTYHGLQVFYVRRHIVTTPHPPPLNKKLLIERLIWKMTGIDFQLNICHSSFTSLIKMTNKMQLCRIIYYSLVPWLLYMFRAMLSLIIRSILTVITASGFIHVCRGRLLSWLSMNS